MLSRKYRVHSWFFKKNKKPAFVIREKDFFIKVYKQEQETPHVAVVVSKKVSPKAVVRNTIQRKVYALFEKHITHLEKAVYVVYVQQHTDELYTDIERTLTEKLLA